MSSPSSNNKIWLITGASSGLGQAMALAALRAGHRVVGTGRSIEKAAKSCPQFEKLGGVWLALDITQSSATQTLLDMVAREEKKIDGPVHWVVVNNASFGLMGTAEQASEEQLLSYMDANVIGTIRVWNAMIPALRRHRTGTLITISSIFGMVGRAGQMMYSAVKASTEALTESYCEILAPFGIKTFIVQPGAFRTKFAGNALMADGELPEDYKEYMKEWMNIVDAVAANPDLADGSPEKFGEAVVDAVLERGLFKGLWEGQDPKVVLRVQLGTDCYAAVSQKVKQLQDGLSKMGDVSASTDLEGTGKPKAW